MSEWTINDVIRNLARRRAPILYTPEYTGHSDTGIFLAVESMKRHTTDEGWQIQDGASEAGYRLCGRRLAVDETSIPKILQETNPGVVILQDKREWDCPPTSFRDLSAKFHNVEELAKHPDIFKLTVLKDAHHNPEYHAQSASEIGCHAWIIYYNPLVVKTLAPYVRTRHCIRVYHTIDRNLIPSFSGNNRKVCLLSGAVSSAYPLRQRLVCDLHGLEKTDYLRHPGYHVRGTDTPSYLKLLSQYKVAICTASMYGFTLRKLIEATACGCAVVTDLPIDEEMPEIDGNLYRVHPQTSTEEINELVQTLARTYNPEIQEQFAQKAQEYYDFRASGRRLVSDIEGMRLWYATLTES